MSAQKLSHPKPDSRLLTVIFWFLVGVFVIAAASLVYLTLVERLKPAPAAPTQVAVIPTPLAPQPSVHVWPAEGTPGVPLTVWGRGWQPNDTLVVCLDDLGDAAEPPIYAVTTANAAGNFVATFNFPKDVVWRSLPDVSVVVESETGPSKAATNFKLLPQAVETPPLPPPATPTAEPPPATITPTAVPPSPTPTCLYDMAFVADVTIPDDTTLRPGENFVKTWRIRNSGTCAWPAGTTWYFAYGSPMEGPNAMSVPSLPPGETVDVSVHLSAPPTPGRYTGYWSLRLPDGRRLDKYYYVRIVVAEPTPTPSPTAAPPPTILNWRGAYYANSALVGAPAFVRDDTAVSFNWGTGAPAADFPADNFAVVWERTLYFEGGTYRFYARSDDGVRVWIDGVLIIDEWHDATGALYQAERLLATGNYTLRVEYYESREVARIQFWWERNQYYPDWRGEYWSNSALNGPLTLVRNDEALNFNWGFDAPHEMLPADDFSIRWTRSMNFSSGVYRFHAFVDDGMRLYVDGHLVMDTWQDGGARNLTAERWLAGGYHTLQVEYYEHTGWALFQFWWEAVTDHTDWYGSYRSSMALSGRPTLERYDPTIDFDWGLGAPGAGLPADNFSVRWERNVTFEPGVYRFYIVADDGVRLFVDARRVLDEWHDHSADEVYQVDVELDGEHTLWVEYYENLGRARIKLWYELVERGPASKATRQ